MVIKIGVQKIVDPTYTLIKEAPPNHSEEFLNYKCEWFYYPIFDIVKRAPIQLDIELNTYCQLKCPQCFQSFDPPKAMDMDMDLYKKIIDEGVEIGVKSIKLNYRGEPLLSPNLLEAIKYAKQRGILEVLINSNTMGLDIEMAKGLIDSKLDLISCSIDGYTKKTYNKIRVGGDLDKVIQNILGLISLKQLKGVCYPKIRIQLVKQVLNEAEIPHFIEFWKSFVDEISIVDQKDYANEKVDKKELSNWFCCQLWQRLFILADGTVMPCCRAMKGGNEIRTNLGNVKDRKIEDIWQSKLMKEMRKLHFKGKSHLVPMCMRCGLRKEVINQNGK